MSPPGLMPLTAVRRAMPLGQLLHGTSIEVKLNDWAAAISGSSRTTAANVANQRILLDWVMVILLKHFLPANSRKRPNWRASTNTSPKQRGNERRGFRKQLAVEGNALICYLWWLKWQQGIAGFLQHSIAGFLNTACEGSRCRPQTKPPVTSGPRDSVRL